MAEARDICGDRLWVSDRPYEAVELFSFAIDGTRSPLSKTGLLRGRLFPPEGTESNAGRASQETTLESGALVAGVSCDTP